MKYLLMLLIPLTMALTSTQALSQDTFDAFVESGEQDLEFTQNCTAQSFIFDSRNEFGSSSDSFDWCFNQVTRWGLNQNNWRERFCRVSQYSRDGRNYWRSNFRHNFRNFRGRNSYDLFDQFNRFYSRHIFGGQFSRVEFRFGQRCGYGVIDLNGDMLPEDFE